MRVEEHQSNIKQHIHVKMSAVHPVHTFSTVPEQELNPAFEVFQGIIHTCSLIMASIQRVCTCLLTLNCQSDGLARLVLSVLVIYSLDIIAPGVRCYCRQDHQRVVQSDGTDGTASYHQYFNFSSPFHLCNSSNPGFC